MSEDIAMPVVIVLIVFAAISFWVFLGHRTAQIKHASKGLNSTLVQENETLKLKTRELEQRIQVLESIVTDRGFQLSQEISRIT